MTLEILTADSLSPLTHGFFTRRGGASSGLLHGLNCGRGSADQCDIVEINRARVAAAMGVSADRLVTAKQVHSPDVVTVTEPFREIPHADGLVTNVPGLVLGVLTADCQPVLFADTQAGVIGAAHAGWRGALDGVLDATVDAMEALGAQRARITAVIGPCISQANYEVGQEFIESFCDTDPEVSRFFTQGRPGKYLFDLPGFGLDRLRRAGVGVAEWVRQCTYADPERFYSYRRATHKGEPDYGRLISTIRL